MFSRINPNQICILIVDFLYILLAIGFETVIGHNDVKTGAGVYFCVTRNTSFSSAWTVIPWEIEQLNIGRAMNLTTGIFTVPTSGRYSFAFSARSSKPDVENYVWLRVNGAYIFTSFGPSNNYNMPLFAVLNLKKGDEIAMVLGDGSLFDNRNRHTHFTGILLEEDLSLV